jgi:hypothetical protein
MRIAAESPLFRVDAPRAVTYNQIQILVPNGALVSPLECTSATSNRIQAGFNFSSSFEDTCDSEAGNINEARILYLQPVVK